MSESSSEQGANSKKRTVAQLVDRLRAKTSAERLSLLAHLSVGRTLCRLRDAIANGEEVSQKAAMALLCCGISLYRRHTLGDREEEEEDSEETNALIKRSAVLIFVLLAAIEASRGERRRRGARARGRGQRPTPRRSPTCSKRPPKKAQGGPRTRRPSAEASRLGEAGRGVGARADRLVGRAHAERAAVCVALHRQERRAPTTRRWPTSSSATRPRAWRTGCCSRAATSDFVSLKAGRRRRPTRSRATSGCSPWRRRASRRRGSPSCATSCSPSCCPRASWACGGTC